MGVYVPTPDTAASVKLDLIAMLADHAQRRHRFAALIKAADDGAALLDALDLSPLALEVVDELIACRDMLDGDADFEPWLGDQPSAHGALDAEDDSEEDEGTALESFGKGFVRAGADDAEDDDPPEDSDPAERDDHHGSDDGEDIGHHASQYAPRPLSPEYRSTIADLRHQAEAMSGVTRNVPFDTLTFVPPGASMVAVARFGGVVR